MTCTRTGAHIFLWQYGVYAYCDAFEVGVADDAMITNNIDADKVAYFRIVAHDFKPIDGMTHLHYIIREVETWWKDDPIQTLITKARRVREPRLSGQAH